MRRSAAVAQDAVELPAGRFRMGSIGLYPEEGPIREVEVDGFAVQRGPVTVGQFARFVEDTGYLTVAERPLDPADYPEADASLLLEGSAVFRPPRPGTAG
jgi:formylglycine-generating enzyme required for sulfatase activity